MKTVVITGALGFIGHNLVRRYLDNKWEVIMVDDLSLHKNANLTRYRLEHVSNSHCTFLNYDCKELELIKSKLPTEKINHIVHLASLPNQATVSRDQLGAVSNINLATLAMCLLANELNTKLIYASSSMVYGNFNSLKGQSENEPLDPVNLYGLLKKQSEELVKTIAKKWIIVRPSAVYGGGDTNDRVISKWILNAITNKPLEVNNSSSMLDFTYVDDLVTGIVAVADNKFIHQTYNLTYGQARSLGEVALLVKHITNSKSEIIYCNVTDNEPCRGTLDISKAKFDFNYKPAHDIVSGLHSHVSWMKKFNGY